MFGLMFFPDRSGGFGEIFRALEPGGRACVSSWAPVRQSRLNEVMFGALHALNPDIPYPKTDVDSLENPDALAAELADTGFNGVAIHRVRRGLEISSAAEFRGKMARGSAPVLMLRRKVGEDPCREQSGKAVEHVARTVGTFPAFLSADAWFGIATR